MLLIVIRRGSAQPSQLPPGLTYQDVPLDGGFSCSVYFDGSMFELGRVQNQVTLTHRAAGRGTILQLNARSNAVTLAKPLDLGLPIYYTSTDGELVISTHVKLLRAAGVTIAVDEAALPEFLLFRYVTPPRTMLRNISVAPIDARVDVRIDGGRLHVADPKWTTVFDIPAERLDLDEAAGRIAGDLKTQVAALAPERERVACLLSGGVDSSILFKLSRDLLELRESHSTGYPFEDPSRNDEKTYAETAAAAMGAAHQYHEFDAAEFMMATVDAIDHAEVPLIALQSVLMELLHARSLSPNVTTVLCGQGADGVFGLSVMYNYFKYRYLVRPSFAPLLQLLAATVSRAGRRSDYRLPFAKLHAYSQRKWDLDFANIDHALWMLGEFGDKAWIRSRYGVDDATFVRNRVNAIRQFNLPTAFDAFSVMDFVSDVASVQDIWGKIGAAHGRFMHYAFNSPGLIRAACQTSWDEKLSEPKRLIRQVGHRIGVPAFILDRPKRGFGIAASRWALPGGVLEPLVTLAAPVFDAAPLRRFQVADERQAMTLWTLINFAVWKRIVVDGEPAATLKNELRAAISQSSAVPA